MIRYSNFFQTESGNLIREMAVIWPLKYAKEIIEDLQTNKEKILGANFNISSLCEFLSSKLQRHKVIFLNAEVKNIEDLYIEKASTNPKTGNIKIVCNQNLIYIQDDADNYDNFVFEFRRYIHHELIHRKQYTQISLENLKRVTDKYVGTEKMKEYLAQKQELMGYAWDLYQEIKIRGYGDKAALRLISTNINNTEFEFLNKYLKFFKPEEKPIRLLLKYLYMYLTKQGI